MASVASPDLKLRGEWYETVAIRLLGVYRRDVSGRRRKHNLCAVTSGLRKYWLLHLSIHSKVKLRRVAAEDFSHTDQLAPLCLVIPLLVRNGASSSLTPIYITWNLRHIPDTFPVAAFFTLNESLMMRTSSTRSVGK
ncbi:hypothetical protein CBL_08756 [Carabus blaptoides fortunei]